MLKTKFTNQLEIIWQGLKDTIPSVKTLALFRQPIIRSTLQDILVINCITIAATNIYEFALFPVIKLLVEDGLTYRFFVYIHFTTWTIPFNIVICGILNVLNWQKISQELPGGLKMPITPPNSNEEFIDTLNKLLKTVSVIVNNSFFRLLLLPGLFAQEFAFSMIPWPFVRHPIQIISLSLIHAFYAFEYDWNKAGLALDKQILFFEQNWTYFLGFGLPLTAIMQLIPSLYAAPAFAMLLPVFVILSTQSTIFTHQQPTVFRLPYFCFAKTVPALATCLCKRKLKKRDTLQSTPVSLSPEAHTHTLTELLNAPVPTSEDNIKPKQPIIYSRHIHKTPQAFSPATEQKLNMNTLSKTVINTKT